MKMTGTANSYGILSKAAQSLSDRKLKALEDDLSFYDQTGLVGVHMSWLLVLLHQNKTAKAELHALYNMTACRAPVTAVALSA